MTLLKKTEKISPRDISLYVDEQLTHNEIFTNENKKKISLRFYGSPGVGKTEILERFPVYRLENINTRIINKFIENYKITYNYFNPIDKQNENILKDLNDNYKIKNHIIKEIEKSLLYDFETAVVVVRQSDIILPEDISGLPSSTSEIGNFLNIISLAKLYKETNPKSKYYEDFLEKTEIILKNIIKSDNKNNGEISTRNTTKFDYTEWEWELHKLSNYKNIKNTLLVLDDIFRSASNNPTILNVMMPIFQQSIVGQRPLPENCSVVITSNEEQSSNGEINYVTSLDHAQKDRLFSYKIVFDVDDWAKHAKIINVHPVAINFILSNPHVLDDEKGYVSPRRWTRFGEILYNKFGLNEEILYNGEGLEQLNFLLKFNFGDETELKYKTLISEFKNFVTEIINEVNIFLDLLKVNKHLDMYKKLIDGGQTLKINIIVHKLIKLFTENILDENFCKNITTFFGDEHLLPDSIKSSLRIVSKTLLAMEFRLKDDMKHDENFKKLFNQIYSIVENIIPILIDNQNNAEEEFKSILKEIKKK